MKAKPSLTTVAETEAPHERNTNATVSKLKYPYQNCLVGTLHVLESMMKMRLSFV